MTRDEIERLLHCARHEAQGAGPNTLAEVCEWALERAVTCDRITAEMRKRCEAAEARLARVGELEGHLAQWQAIARENAEEVRAAKKKGEEAAFHLEMYAKAWTRELGGMLIPKAHRIDALVLTTRALREALRELVRVMSHQLARGEDPEEGAFDRAWVAACAALSDEEPKP